MTDEIPEPDQIPEHLVSVWRCWSRLSQDRQWIGGGMGPAVPRGIEFDRVASWCMFHGVPAEDITFFDRCIRAMDEVYFEWYRARLPPPTGGS
jgi:hypothetical protein